MALTKQTLIELLALIPFIEPVINHENISFRYLSNGLTNENYWIQIDDEQYVLRLNNPESKRLSLNRDDETSIIKKVSELSLVPEILFQHEQPSFRLSKWIPGIVWTKDSFKQRINLNRLAQALKQLHSQPNSELPTMNLLERLEHYRLMILRRHGQLPAIEKQILSKTIKNFIIIQPSITACLCHNDLNAANILESQSAQQSQLCFLDWEYAAVNDPLFELAVICVSNDLGDADKEYLLHAYMGSQQTVHLQETFRYWCWFYKYISLLWGLVILPIEQSLPHNLEQQFERLNTELQQL